MIGTAQYYPAHEDYSRPEDPLLGWERRQYVRLPGEEGGFERVLLSDSLANRRSDGSSGGIGGRVENMGGTGCSLSGRSGGEGKEVAPHDSSAPIRTSSQVGSGGMDKGEEGYEDDGAEGYYEDV